MADISDQRIVDAYQKVRNDASGVNWFTIGYEGNTKLVFQNEGSGGVSELVSHFQDNECQYAYLKVKYEADESKRTKFVLLSWAGPSASVLKKGKMSVHKSAVKQVVREFSVEIHVTDRSEIDDEIVLDRIKKANY
eukprot:TRINITY_DN13799_c0_g1_i1.p1 TRINITY_DN13799_c0_g1~~TRINITY_DN13799_c0_g1_i1.p1  ORF type:complete len:136 (+),score=32.57 TRINITY_DN13799_c0_g1_i1:137-544(+)